MKFIKSLVANVIANSENAFTNDDTEKLESLGEEVLSKIATDEVEPDAAPKAETEAPKAETEAPKAETEAPKAETEAPKAETEAPKAETEAPKTEVVDESVEQKANKLIEKVEDAELKDLLSNACQHYADKKQALVSNVVDKSKLTTEEVSKMPISQIERLDLSLKEFSFEGRGTTLKNNNNVPTFKKPQTLKEMFGQGD